MSSALGCLRYPALHPIVRELTCGEEEPWMQVLTFRRPSDLERTLAYHDAMGEAPDEYYCMHAFVVDPCVSDARQATRLR